jgi:hypothetical protein
MAVPLPREDALKYKIESDLEDISVATNEMVCSDRQRLIEKPSQKRTSIFAGAERRLISSSV